jgi:fibro-slime domain-containing protein
MNKNKIIILFLAISLIFILSLVNCSSNDGDISNANGNSSDDGLVETVETSVCGDGYMSQYEKCDDNNTINGDGCSSSCELEYGWICPAESETCIARSCGDGIIAGNEVCDDGNLVSGDGCYNCQLEPGYACPNPGEACISTTCGDSQKEGLEQCDDGNVSDGDGCDNNCRLEFGYTCPTPGGTCILTICGDSKIEGLEQCDDGNFNSGDGCDDSCQLEPGYACPIPGGTCFVTTCGDSKKEGLEQCDDGNNLAGDGCDPVCKKELPYYLDSYGSYIPVCGDGITIYPGEECDDGNIISGDGCSSTCTIETGYNCTDFSITTPPTLDLQMIIRDFRGWDEYTDLGIPGNDGLDGYPNFDAYSGDRDRGHEDFQHYACAVESTGLIENYLSDDYKPIFKRYDGLTGCNNQLTGSSEFEQWYRTIFMINQELRQTFTLSLTDALTEKYEFQSTSFFPIDDIGYGNSYNNHNYSFTTEFHFIFKYKGGENIIFVGDDDYWVFINGHLAIDLGGLHPPRTGSVELSNSNSPDIGIKYDERFDIYEGGIYEIRFFHAERHTDGSNYHLTLTKFQNTGVSVCTANCGDGLIRGTEECDDGNLNDGDGCNTLCQIESRYRCIDEPSICAIPQCDDNIVDYPEQCDDGNLISGDGCDSNCQIETCGNATLDLWEECDEGVNNGGSGNCTTSCKSAICGDYIIQDGIEECDNGNGSYLCNSNCQFHYCGDGIVRDGVEICDDGINDGSYDSCKPDCSLKAPYCGDGKITHNETCDDYNTISGDGCNNTCHIESNFLCIGEPSICTAK